MIPAQAVAIAAGIAVTMSIVAAVHPTAELLLITHYVPNADFASRNVVEQPLIWLRDVSLGVKPHKETGGIIVRDMNQSRECQRAVEWPEEHVPLGTSCW
jgi:hypothetical protein